MWGKGVLALLTLFILLAIYTWLTGDVTTGLLIGLIVGFLVE